MEKIDLSAFDLNRKVRQLLRNNLFLLKNCDDY